MLDASLVQQIPRGITISDAVCQGLRLWLSAPRETAITGEGEKRTYSGPDYDSLALILNKGTKDQVEGIRSSLQAFVAGVELNEIRQQARPPVETNRRRRAGTR